MRRMIAMCAMVFLLSGCSQKAAFEDLADGVCTSAQEKLVAAHISSQIDAIAKEDWKLAYSFASPVFRFNVEIDQFAYIIGTQYGMLIDNQGYEFSGCTVTNQKITQQVSVTSNATVTDLTYILSVQKEVLGVDSATASEAKLEA